MDVKEAGEAVRWIRPKVTIPMHNLKTDPLKLIGEVGSDHKVVILKSGASFMIG
jgi:L-ascorbate metabolism protein UlaG (beta-lactamase superfamily)